MGKRERIRNQCRFREEVTEGLRTLMAIRGFSPTRLAERSGLTTSRVREYLGGVEPLDLNTLATLTLAMGVGVHVIFGADPEEMRLARIEKETHPPATHKGKEDE